jgi:hypothetical protein
MISAPVAYLEFAAVGLASFALWQPRVAVLVVFLGGWLVLPVGVYPAEAADAVFPYWITGLAVPSQMLLTKAWVAPVTALLGALAFDWPRVRQLRATAFDAPVALWVAWPLVQGVLLSQPNAASPISSLGSWYLAGAWGAPWLLGRLYCSSSNGQRRLVTALTWSALACLPIAVVESAVGSGWCYQALYGPHPFRGDGAERYLGFRPIGGFEHGNQYGLWIALCAVCAVWLARSTTATGAARRRAQWTAALVVFMTVAAQSVGAVLLMVLGLAVLMALNSVSISAPAASVSTSARSSAGPSVFSLKRLTLVTMATFVLGTAVYLSGVVPVRQLATETTLGRAVVDGIKSTGRGSLLWRVSQDQKLLHRALERPLTGSAQWDWWRPDGRRPWGLPLLVAGQFGLIGLGLGFGLLMAPAIRVGLRTHLPRVWRDEGLPVVMATLVLLSVADALLNSFVFFPALLAAGGLAGAQRSQRAQTGQQPGRNPDRRAV